MIPVLVELDKHRSLGFELERFGEDQVVIFLPNTPNMISGRVVVVAAVQVTALSVSSNKIKDCMEQFGFGVSDLLQATKGRTP
jgi:uncharacterized membrane protein